MENSTDGGAWQAIVHGVTESDVTEHSTYSTCNLAEFCFVLFCFVFNPDHKLQKIIETQSLIRRVDLTV